jgi:glycosyltransferase involved in cell wall biosynthesis
MYESKLPLVSICLPTFNGAKWIQESVNSALRQTYENIELIVVDDGSTDDTVEQIRSIDDPRIAVHTNGRNVGLIRNWNKCLELARGEFIKFLFQDDILYPDCVERMMSLFIKYDGIGLVFCARDILIDRDLDESAAKRWLEYCEVLHSHFDSLGEFNSGRGLFMQHMRNSFLGNWIAEPSSVMVKKECFFRLGQFNTRLYQVGDLEMWLRILYFYNVGFIEDKLTAFRIHSKSTTVANARSRHDFLDQFWLFEELLRHKEIKDGCPEIVEMRNRELDRQKILMVRPLLAWRRLRYRNGIKQAIEDLKHLPLRARFFLWDYPTYKLRDYL